MATHSSHNLQEHLKALFHTHLIVELTDHRLAGLRSVEYNLAAHWPEQYKLLLQLLCLHCMLRDLEVLGMQHTQPLCLQQPAPNNPAERLDTDRMLQQELLVGHKQTVAAH